jgi:photosystem II stability/assembly factor-like uncharacterized protein
MTRRSHTFALALLATSCLIVALAGACGKPSGGPRSEAAKRGPYPVVDASFTTALEWRFVGPSRGGRVNAVAGDPNDPLVFYMGTAHSGVWKTTDAGLYWRNVSDRFFERAPVGAMEVSRSHPNIIYVGKGESTPRQYMTPGDGVWKSTDGGETWTNVGLRQSPYISKIRIHPTNPDIVYVGAMGDMYGTNPDRGVFRTKDGGKTWEKVLYKTDQTSAHDLTMDPKNPNVLYASLNHLHKLMWDEVSGGPDSGLYKTTDGGNTWTELTRNPGMPKGVVGKIGVSASAAKSGRVYAIIEAAEGGVYRSDDGGGTWQKLYDDREQRREAPSYLHITADPVDADTVYVQHVQVWKSTDAGKTFTALSTMQHSDHHALWIDPKNNKRMIDGSDGGASVTLNGGYSWSSLDNQPTADFFSLAIDDQDPYYLYAAQNDNQHVGIPSRSTGGGGITLADYIPLAGGEGGQTAVKPDGSVVYGCDRTTIVRNDLKTGVTRNISVWPEDSFGAPPKDVKYRFYYTFPIYLSPHDPNRLYTGAQFLFRTTNEGESWEKISPDVTRNHMEKMQKVPGGPVTSLASSLFYVSLIRSIEESPIKKGEIWVGTDDGNVQMTPDDGKTWQNVTPKEMQDWTTVTNIDISAHDAGRAYVAGNRHRVSDNTSYVFKTTDYGKTWQTITNGFRPNDFVYVVREDPKRPGLLFAGAETGVYVSFDDGANWQPLQRNLPPIAVLHLRLKRDDLVISTHGRGFWIMDNISALRQITPEVTRAAAHLFEVLPTDRQFARGGYGRGRGGVGVQSGGLNAYEDTRNPDGKVVRTYLTGGGNPLSGVPVEYYLKEAPSGEVTLTFLDAEGKEIRTFSSTNKEGGALPAAAGMNRFFWNMLYPGGREAKAKVQLAGFEASRAVPPTAMPGKYTVRLTAGGQTYERPFEITINPKTGVTEADLKAQFDLMVKIRDTFSETSDALTKLRDVRDKLEAVQQTAGGPGPNKEVMDKLYAIETALTRITLSHPLEVTPKGLINKLGTLSGTVAQNARPTKQQYEVYEDLVARIAVQMKALDEVLKNDAVVKTSQ